MEKTLVSSVLASAYMLLNVVMVMVLPTLPPVTARAKHTFKLPTVNMPLATIVLANILVTEKVMLMVAGTSEACSVRWWTVVPSARFPVWVACMQLVPTALSRHACRARRQFITFGTATMTAGRTRRRRQLNI